MPDPIDVQAAAVVGADDRQRALNEVCRRALRDFYGRKVTPTLMAEAEATLRAALGDAIRAGTYVLPDGLALDRVELGTDMRIKVLFKKVVLEPDADLAPLNLRALVPEADKTTDSRDPVARGTVMLKDRFDTLKETLGVAWTMSGAVPDPVARDAVMLKDRFEAVAAEINDDLTDPDAKSR